MLLVILEHVAVGQMVMEGVRMAHTGGITRLILDNAVTHGILVFSIARRGNLISPHRLISRNPYS